MFFQPAFVFPQLEAYQPVKYAAILAMAAYFFSRPRSSVPFFSNKVNVFFVIFIVLQVMSASAIWLAGGVEMLSFWFRIFIIYYLIVKSVNTPERVTQVSLMIVLAIVYLSYFSLSKYGLAYIPAMRIGGFGLYENPNDLAIILVAAIPLALLVANTSRSFIIRYFFIAVAGLFAFNILFTGSRNGLLGLLAVGVLGIIYSKRTAAFLKYTLLAVLIGAVFTVGKASVLSRHDLSGLSGDDSSENRIEQWKAGIGMLERHPLLGVGPFQFSDNAAEYGGIHGLQAHNTLLQVFAESGIPGGIFFALFTFYPFYRGLKIATDKTLAQTRSAIYYKFLIASLAGFWVCAFFSNRYQFYSLYILVALLVAVSETIVNQAKGDVIIV
jgi:O-antigen ligase